MCIKDVGMYGLMRCHFWYPTQSILIGVAVYSYLWLYLIHHSYMYYIYDKSLYIMRSFKFTTDFH